jgi:hypothetical protein
MRPFATSLLLTYVFVLAVPFCLQFQDLKRSPTACERGAVSMSMSKPGVQMTAIITPIWINSSHGLVGRRERRRASNVVTITAPRCRFSRFCRPRSCSVG